MPVKRLKKLGRKPSVPDARTFKLSKYLKPYELPSLRPSMGYLNKVRGWPMYMNDRLGDCVIAAAAHMIQQWTMYAGKPRKLTDGEVLAGYIAMGGYVPGDPTTDNGADMMTALKHWRKKGFGGHKIVAFAEVDKFNQEEMAQAMYLFGSLFAGLGLPAASQDADIWQVPSYGPVGEGAPGSWGGHCISIMGYRLDTQPNGPGMKVITWGQVTPMTWNYWRAYGEELYAIVTQDWINEMGKSPPGFDLEELQRDLIRVTT